MREVHIKIIKIWDNVCVAVAFIYLYTIMVYSYSVDTLYLTKIAFLAVLGVTAFKVLLTRKVPNSRYYMLLVIYFIYLFVSSFWAYDLDVHFGKIVTIVQVIALSLCFFYIFDNEKNIKRFIWINLINGYYMCVHSLIFYGGLTTFIKMMSVSRLGSEISQANVFGYNAAITAVYSFYLALYEEKKYFYILMGLPLIMAFSSGSRKAFLVIIMGYMMLTYLKNRTEKLGRTFLYVGIVAIIFYAGLQLPMFEVAMRRLEGLFNIFSSTQQVDSSTALREHYASMGWEFFLQKPILGHGMASFAEMIYKNTYSHNNYIEVLVNGGVVGLVVYYMLKIYPWYKMIVPTLNFHKLSTLFFTLLSISFIYDLGAVTYYSKSGFLVLGVYYGLVYSNETKHREQEKIKIEQGRIEKQKNNKIQNGELDYEARDT